MNFKEALIAHLQGEKVEVAHQEGSSVSMEPMDDFLNRQKLPILMIAADAYYQFRLAPRTITVNGVEVPAPESVAPKADTSYFVPCVLRDDFSDSFTWRGGDFDKWALQRGLVYLNKEDAIARAKAMLLFK